MAALTATTGVLDVQSIVSQLMTVERQPLTKLQGSAKTLDTQISAFGKLQSLLGTLQDTSRSLMNVTTWQAATGTSANSDAVAVTTSAGAPQGGFSVRVDALAQRQSVTTGLIDSATAAFGSGTLKIQMGSVANGSFTADAQRPEASISIPSGATLADVRSAINNANVGVSATLVNDSGKVRLMLRSTDSGASNAFEVTTVDDDGNDADAAGLSALAYDPSGSGNMTLMQAAQDSAFNVSGLDMHSSSNVVEGVFDGVTITLKQKTTQPVDIDVATDASAIRASVDKFVSAYNALNGALADLTKYDADTKTAGTLQGNRAAVMLQQKLREVLGQTVNAGTIANLSNAGIRVQRDGSLQVDSTAFSNAAANPKALQTLFANSDANDPTKVGIARQMDSLLTQVLGTDGSIGSSVTSLQKRKADITTQQDRLNEKLTQTEANLTKLYTQLNSNLSSMSNMSSYFNNLLSQSKG